MGAFERLLELAPYSLSLSFLFPQSWVIHSMSVRLLPARTHSSRWEGCRLYLSYPREREKRIEICSPVVPSCPRATPVHLQPSGLCSQGLCPKTDISLFFPCQYFLCLSGVGLFSAIPPWQMWWWSACWWAVIWGLPGAILILLSLSFGVTKLSRTGGSPFTWGQHSITSLSFYFWIFIGEIICNKLFQIFGRLLSSPLFPCWLWCLFKEPGFFSGHF